MCSGEMKTRWCVFQSKYKLNQPFTIIGLSNISYVLFSCSDLCAIAWGCCAAGTLGNALADPTSRASQPSLSSWHYPGWDRGAGWHWGRIGNWCSWFQLQQQGLLERVLLTTAAFCVVSDFCSGSSQEQKRCECLFLGKNHRFILTHQPVLQVKWRGSYQAPHSSGSEARRAAGVESKCVCSSQCSSQPLAPGSHQWTCSRLHWAHFTALLDYVTWETTPTENSRLTWGEVPGGCGGNWRGLRGRHLFARYVKISLCFF